VGRLVSGRGEWVRNARYMKEEKCDDDLVEPKAYAKTRCEATYVMPPTHG